MNLRALTFLGFAGFIAHPALAQTAPTTVQVSVDSLLAAGYEVKAVTVLSDAAIKEVFPTGGPYPSQVLITLQRGNSIAVCEDATTNRLSLADARMRDATHCFKR
jgi:hypothetical protein